MSFSPNPDRLILPVSQRDHCQGNSTATITLVEYGDFQCPGCRMAHQIIPFIQHQLEDQIRFVFRHFPQSEMHPQAYHAAEAAEAAAAQGKFWEMHHELFTHQSNLTDGYLVEYAIALFLDVNQFLAEMTSDCHTARVESDIESGKQSGVIKTPTFFINGLKYNDDHDLEALLAAVTQANNVL